MNVVKTVSEIVTALQLTNEDGKAIKRIINSNLKPDDRSCATCKQFQPYDNKPVDRYAQGKCNYQGLELVKETHVCPYWIVKEKEKV